MGSDDVKLRYIDDDPDSYSNIFQNAKTDITKADQSRLIASLKALGEGENLENVLDIDRVLRYFVVHNFVCNGDSYTGSMVHNYYLYEEDGRLSMIPWDYNLAYGTFQSGDATSTVNEPIDSPVTGGDSRPMVDWIWEQDEYTELYHQYFREFLETVNITGLIEQTAALIAPYVEKDPTAFYSNQEFQTGAETLGDFCRLRTESILGQLEGTIPSTSEGQAEDASSLVDASFIRLSDMGTMDRGGGSGDGERPFPSDSQQEGAAMPFPSEDASAFSQARGQPAAILRSPEGSAFPGVYLPGESPAAVSGSAWLLAAVSCGILLAGLLFARLYRRGNH